MSPSSDHPGWPLSITGTEASLLKAGRQSVKAFRVRGEFPIFTTCFCKDFLHTQAATQGHLAPLQCCSLHTHPDTTEGPTLMGCACTDPGTCGEDVCEHAPCTQIAHIP